MFRLTRLSTIAIALLLTSVVATPSTAHRASKWYGARWSRDIVRWSFDNDFPRGDGIRKAVRKGSRQWNRADADLRFRWRPEREAGRINPCSDRRNVVDWRRLDGPGGDLAVTIVCASVDHRGPGTMYSFHMIFDRSESWHTDPSTEPSPFEVDLWAVASHEFGHASGRISGGPRNSGHFRETSRYCPNILDPRRHTMCPSEELIGAQMRTLERHDKDAFRNAYGRRS